MKPTASQLKRFRLITALGCIIEGCKNEPCLHHIHTGMGRRKDHDKVIPLCYDHHQGEEGFHFLGKKKWQAKYGTEQELMDKVNDMLEMI